METNYKRILVPLDGSQLAEGALSHAGMVARLCDAEMTLLIVVPPIKEVIETTTERFSIDEQWETRKSQALRYLASLRERSECHGLRIHTEVEIGPVAETILNYAENRAVDLIVITTHGRSGIQRWVWGSTAEKVLRAARTTVMLVRSGAPVDRGDVSVAR